MWRGRHRFESDTRHCRPNPRELHAAGALNVFMSCSYRLFLPFLRHMSCATCQPFLTSALIGFHSYRTAWGRNVICPGLLTSRFGGPTGNLPLFDSAWLSGVRMLDARTGEGDEPAARKSYIRLRFGHENRRVFCYDTLDSFCVRDFGSGGDTMIQSKTIELIIPRQGKTTCLVASVLHPGSDYVCKRVPPTQRRHPFFFP